MSTYEELTHGLKFDGYVSRTSLNNWSIERYELNENEYRLVQYRTSANGEMSHIDFIEINQDEYHDLDYDEFNGLVRFQAVSELFHYGN